MLTITVGAEEFFDDENQTFFTVGGTELQFEHSLVSLSKWESKYERPFLSSKAIQAEEIADYIVMMAFSPGVTIDTINEFTEEDFKAVNQYIESKQTATTFGEMPQRKGKGEVITSELIYYWMVTFNIPMECERWHLNRLFSLIQICNIKGEKPKSISRREIAEQNAKINAERRKKLGSSG